MDEIWFSWWGFSCIPGSYIVKLFGTVTGLKGTKTEMFTTVKPEKKKKNWQIRFTHQTININLKLKTMKTNWNHSPRTTRMCILHQIKTIYKAQYTTMVSEWLGIRGWKCRKHHALLPDFRTMVRVWNGRGRTEEIEGNKSEMQRLNETGSHVWCCIVLYSHTH